MNTYDEADLNYLPLDFVVKKKYNNKKLIFIYYYYYYYAQVLCYNNCDSFEADYDANYSWYAVYEATQFYAISFPSYSTI